jgi:CrcB protein
MIPLYLSIAGGFGAVCRFAGDGLIRVALGRVFPWGTLIINITGSFILGILTGLVLYRHGSTNAKLIIGTGFCGGLTTFSTASFETVRLVEEHKLDSAVLQALGNMLFSLIAAALGIWLISLGA